MSLVAREGFEPSSSRLKAGRPGPLDERAFGDRQEIRTPTTSLRRAGPIHFGAANSELAREAGIEPALPVLETGALPLSYTPMEPTAGIEPTFFTFVE